MLFDIVKIKLKILLIKRILHKLNKSDRKTRKLRKLALFIVAGLGISFVFGAFSKIRRILFSFILLGLERKIAASFFNTLIKKASIKKASPKKLKAKHQHLPVPASK